MSYNVRVSRMAVRDLQRIRKYIAQKNPAAGERILESLKASFRELEEMPQKFEVYAQLPKYHRMVAGNYLVFYVIAEKKNEVQIRRVFDGRMDIPKRLSR